MSVGWDELRKGKHVQQQDVPVQEYDNKEAAERKKDEEPDASNCFARARIGRATLHRLSLRKCKGDPLRRAFNYHGIGHLDLVDNGHIEFHATTPDGVVWNVAITGRNLLPLYEAIEDERATWVAEIPEGRSRGLDDKALAVDSITWTKVAEDKK